MDKAKRNRYNEVMEEPTKSQEENIDIKLELKANVSDFKDMVGSNGDASNEPVTKHAGGRPSLYTQELSDSICALISEGKSVRTICLMEEMPSLQTIFTWLRTHKEFLEQYERAKEESTNAHLETIEDLGDEAIALSQAVDPKSSGAVVQAVKLKSDNLKWVMSKLKPKKYGDKMDVTSDGKAIKGNSIIFTNFKENE